MSKDALEQVGETFRIRRGLMTMPIAMFLFPQILICAFLLIVIVSKKTPADLFQRWEVWGLAINLFLVVPAGCFLIQKAYSRRNAILFTRSSLVQQGLLKPFELKLRPETKLAVYMTPVQGFVLQEFGTAGIFSKSGDKGIQLGNLTDINRAELNRLLVRLAPHLELTSGLVQLLNSAKASGKPLPVAEDFARKALGDIRFKGVHVNPPFNMRLIFCLSLLGVFLVYFIAMVVSQDMWKAFLVMATGIVSLASLGIVGAVLNRFEKMHALVGSEGVGLQSSKGGIRRAIPYRLLGDLNYTVTESKVKRLATISSWKGEEMFKVFVVIESDEHLAQLDQAIQDAQPKLGGPLGQENGQ